jgi:hypothetical protein
MGAFRLKSEQAISLSGKVMVNINLVHNLTSGICPRRNKCDEMNSNSLRNIYTN